MDWNELLNYKNHIQDVLISNWQVLTATNILAIGWLLSIKKNLSLIQKTLGSIMYFLVVLTNVPYLLRNYRILQAVQETLQKIPAPKELSGTNLLNIIQSEDFRNRIMCTGILYGAGVILMLFLIWNNKIWKKIRSS